MRKLILLSALLLWLSAHAHKQVITTYNEGRQEITLHYFMDNFEEVESKISFNIGYLNAIPVSNPYFSKGACRSMQLNTEGTFLYFLSGVSINEILPFHRDPSTSRFPRW